MTSKSDIVQIKAKYVTIDDFMRYLEGWAMAARLNIEQKSRKHIRMVRINVSEDNFINGRFMGRVEFDALGTFDFFLDAFVCPADEMELYMNFMSATTVTEFVEWPPFMEKRGTAKTSVLT